MPCKRKHKTGNAPKWEVWPLAGVHSSGVTSLAAPLAPLSAVAESSIVGADQPAAAGEDAAPESLRANNGFDLTRPQTAFEVRGLDETSSNDTSETNRAQMALRLESLIPLDVGWRRGLLTPLIMVRIQVPQPGSRPQIAAYL